MNRNKYTACLLLSLISVCSNVAQISAGNHGFTSSKVITKEQDHKEIETWFAGNKNDGFVRCTLNFKTGHLNVKATSQDKKTVLKEIFINGRELWKPYIKSVSFEGNFFFFFCYYEEDSDKIKKTFENCNKITSIEILNKVEYINNEAFEGFDSLISLNVKGCVENICDSAFKDCTQLICVDIKSSVKSIQNCAFANCRSLQSINIQGSVDLIFGLVFVNCNNLTNINIEGKVKRISNINFAFFGCNSLPLSTKLKLYKQTLTNF